MEGHRKGAEAVQRAQRGHGWHVEEALGHREGAEGYRGSMQGYGGGMDRVDRVQHSYQFNQCRFTAHEGQKGRV